MQSQKQQHVHPTGGAAVRKRRFWIRASMVVALLALAGVSMVVRREFFRPPASLPGLPLIELPASTHSNDVLVVLLSGDGGWADLDKTLGEAFQARGISTVGFDCLKYFWKKRQPEEVTAMLAQVITHYQQIWQKKRVVLAGFSFGACWLPFLINRLPEEIRDQISLYVLLSPSDFVNVEIHMRDWMGDERRPGALEVLPEARRITGPLLCVYGVQETDAICPMLKGSQVTVLPMQGGHHYNWHYQPVIKAIFKRMDVVLPPATP